MKKDLTRQLQITVIGDANADDEKYHVAYETGKIVAELNAILITGGRGGVMEAASKGAHESGGKVVAILPGDSHDEANEYCDIVIPTGIGHARNSITVLAADVVIVIGGGAGTLSEMAFAWVYQRPILALDFVPGWSMELAGKKIDQRISSSIVRITSLETLKRKIESIKVDFH